jgi:hypothetical protein
LSEKKNAYREENSGEEGMSVKWQVCNSGILTLLVVFFSEEQG